MRRSLGPRTLRRVPTNRRRLAPFAVASLVAIATALVLAGYGIERDFAEAERARSEVEATRSDDAAPSTGTVPPPSAAGEAPSSETAVAELAGSWDGVDLERIRQALPDNAFWERAAPTRDAEILAARAADQRFWDAELGKVMANTATDAEIEAFYAHRQRVSADYVEFTTHVLDHHGDALPAQDAQMLKLARTLHLARLAEVPRRLQEALDRAAGFREARAAWLESEERFANDPGAEPSPSERDAPAP